jgi:pimeloyl-ACP methyl ester carboxylesterase
MSGEQPGTDAAATVGVEPPVGIVELRISPELACMAEYLHASSDGASVVLLHDRGGDLDGMHPIAWGLHAAGFNVVNLDLPGHGLSAGDYDLDSARAIVAAGLFADPNLDRGVAFVAEGETAGVLLTTAPRAPIAMVLLRPQVVPDGWSDSGIWPHTPALVLVDPADTASDAVAAELIEQSRAWNLRAFIHRSSDETDADMWQVQTTSLTTRFVLEQRTYWASRIAAAGDIT